MCPKIQQLLALPTVTALVPDADSSWLNDFRNTPPPTCFPNFQSGPLSLLSTQPDCNYRKILCIFFLILFIYLGHHTACGILVPRPGIEPRPSAVKVWSPNH